MSGEVIDGVTINCPITTSSPVARANIDTIVKFFSVYLKDLSLIHI